MEKAMLKFGDVSTACIQLRLIASNGQEYEANPIHLHSRIAQKSNFLESMISESLSSDDWPIKIEVITTVPSFENYVKCFGMMYSCANRGFVCFSSVDECLAILQVAAHLLVDDCINGSMEYLAAVSWTPLEESQIRVVLSSLQLQTSSPDLTARLEKFGCSDYLDMLKKSTKEVLSFIFERESWWVEKQEEREIICKYLQGKCDGDSSPEIAAMCKPLFYEEFTANVEIIKSCFKLAILVDERERAGALSALLWLVEMFEKWDTSMYEVALKTFFQDEELAKRIALRATVQHKEDALTIMVIFLKAIRTGKIITTRAYRLSFLETWVPVAVDLMADCRLKDSFEEEVIKVFETIPLSDQKSIYQVWTDAYRDKNMDSTKIFKWWFEKLEEGYCKSKVEE